MTDRLTTDRNDPRLGRGPGGHGLNDAYLVLSEDERAKGFIRPLRLGYKHVGAPGEKLPLCDGTITYMADSIAETYARQPSFYGATFCAGCNTHLKVGETGEFVWVNPDGTTSPDRVGT